jgi:hypothetical protein
MDTRSGSVVSPGSDRHQPPAMSQENVEIVFLQ